jgi:hypothetical protein
MIHYSKYFKEMCFRKYVELSDWHPALGKNYYRPLDVSMRGFYQMMETRGEDWVRWKEIREAIPPLNEVISTLEEWGYRFEVRNGLIDFRERPKFENIKLLRPITKISKNLVRSKMNEYPVLNGMLYDADLKRENACRAIQMISEGMRVTDALKQCGTSYKSICDYGYKGTGRQHQYKTLQRVKECLERIESGENLKTVLKEMKLGVWSFYRYRGLVY